jgi:hypothetical protein
LGRVGQLAQGSADYTDVTIPQVQPLSALPVGTSALALAGGSGSSGGVAVLGQASSAPEPNFASLLKTAATNAATNAKVATNANVATGSSNAAEATAGSSTYTPTTQGNVLSTAAQAAEQALATDTTGAALLPYAQAGVTPSSVIGSSGVSTAFAATLQKLGFTEATDPNGGSFWVGPNQIGNAQGFTPVTASTTGGTPSGSLPG